MRASVQGQTAGEASGYIVTKKEAHAGCRLGLPMWGLGGTASGDGPPLS